MALKTNYKDDVYSGNRKYNMINNSDGTVSFEDVTSYSKVGDTFGAGDINATNAAINNRPTTQEVNNLLESLEKLSAPVASSSSWDDLVVTGKTKFDWVNAGLTNDPNGSTTGRWLAITVCHPSGYANQIAISNYYAKPKLFIRKRTADGVWNAWVQFGSMEYDSDTNTLNIVM